MGSPNRRLFMEGSLEVPHLIDSVANHIFSESQINGGPYVRGNQKIIIGPWEHLIFYRPLKA
jgi:hypothetical protein